ncbi:MAG: glycosyltransferase family 2 protein [Bacteroidales bacterium]|nr:glycosyltransferase family 2 protein [Bacteroidales bacterium]MCF8386540.1 glycosyltransferase family 2 protein [Bacteroidales bacterium]MCF8398603.1 glycosyltransferase family 2 protein [Bacteroidales bacterium]
MIKSEKRDSLKVLIIIPAYNEEDNIVGVIHEIHEDFPNFYILVINDGSIDNTSELARSTGLARVIDLPVNMGIGAAVQTGFKYAHKNGYDITLQFDGDGQHMVKEISKIVDPVIQGDVDMMIGSRFVQNLESYKSQPVRRLGIKIFNFISYLLIRQRIKDQTSGFRAFNKELIGFLAKYYPVDYPEPEVIILLGKNGFKIGEVFTQMRERQGGASSIPLSRGPFYMTKVLLAMFMAALREKRIKPKSDV